MTADTPSPLPLSGPGGVDGPNRGHAGLALAVLAHASLSAPVPPAVGVAEAAIATLLLTATGIRRPVTVATGTGWPEAPGHDVARCRAACVLIWLPVLVGVAQGASPSAMARDLIPLAFVLLPLSLGAGLAGRLPLGLYSHGLAAAGAILALRHLAVDGVLPGTAWALAALGEAPDHLLANAILVLFAAVWLPVAALRLGRRGSGWRRRLPLALLAAGGALAATTAAAVTLQRATLILAAAAWLYAVGEALARPAGRPAAAIAVAAGAAGLALAGPELAQLVELVKAKTDLVGLNTRWREAQAVAARLANAPGHALFGLGWGHQWANPASGGLAVGYTHNAVTYLWLKAGIVGLAAAAVAIMGPALTGWWRLWHRDHGLALALAASLGTGSLIHADFKTLGFGLLLIVLESARRTDTQRDFLEDKAQPYKSVSGYA